MRRGWVLLLVASALTAVPAWAAEGIPTDDELLVPYTGPQERGADTTTLDRSIMCGYQGWFTHAADGYGVGSRHWGEVLAVPPVPTVELWPDLGEFPLAERFPTTLHHADGRVAEVFSSTRRDTVLRHFSWMREYGIDGAFIQRFAGEIADPASRLRTDAVLSNCREAANRHGRSFAVMYDTDFDRATVELLKRDWTMLYQRMRITDSHAYLQHRGHPLVVLWGWGFWHRKMDAEAAEDLLRFFKRPENGACTIMLGTDNDWRMLPPARGARGLELADVIQPWTVGRFGSPTGGDEFYAKWWPDDLAWCKQHGKDYYPVIWPGFSWSNLMRARGASAEASAKFDYIPRLGGWLLWSQVLAVQRYGMDKAYVAMFDELDEGTAIMKCTDDVPQGGFLGLQGLPSDHYLRLAGAAGKLLRGVPVSEHP